MSGHKKNSPTTPIAFCHHRDPAGASVSDSAASHPAIQTATKIPKTTQAVVMFRSVLSWDSRAKGTRNLTLFGFEYLFDG